MQHCFIKKEVYRLLLKMYEMLYFVIPYFRPTWHSWTQDYHYLLKETATEKNNSRVAYLYKDAKKWKLKMLNIC